MKSKLFIVLVLISLISPVFGQVSFTANVTNPGTLSEVIGDKWDITNLTVTGNIDARDFRVMRDMSLVSLDLSGTSIAEFNGDAGYGWPIHYLSNIIPNDALRFPTGNTTLVSLKLPATITGIGNSAISSMQALTSITLPATLRYIDDYAFAWSSGLKGIDFSACTMLDSIGSAAFQECTNLSALDLSKCTSLTKIGSGAFYHCLGLKTVILPSSLITLKDNAFGSCPVLNSIDFSKCKSLKTIDDDAIVGCPQLITLDLSLCSSLDSINGYAVSGCPGLQTVKLPASLRSIGKGSFAMDTSLVTVDFSNCANLKTIGLESFQYCYAIQKLDLSNCSALDSISSYAFYQCNKIEEIDLPESIRTIGGDAFFFLEDHLKIVRIKNPVPPKTEWVSFSTSTDEKNLAVLYVPVGSKKVYQNADGGGSWFGFSYIVEEVPGIKAKSIENSSAGNLNTQLTSEEKSTLTHLKIRGDIDARDFKTLRDEMPALTEIDLIKSNIVEYSGTEGTVSENRLYPVYTIPSYAFCNPKTGISKNSLTSVYLPIITDKVGEFAFKGCSGLKLIEMQVLSIIGDYAFAACSNLSSFDFSKAEMLNSIGNFAFSGCTKLNGELDFSNNTNWVDSIGQGAFFNCNKITSIKFPEFSYLTTVADSAFMNCSGITSFDFPASTKTIGEKAFFNSGLKGTAIFPYDIDTIGYQAFSKCSGLTSFVIDGDNQWPFVYSSIDGVLFDETKTRLVACPNGKTGLYQVPDTVKTIGGYGFDQCMGLTGIELPLALKSIEKYGLKGCTNLSSIKIYNPLPPDVGVKVFNGVNTGTCKLYVPKGSKTAYQSADQWKDFANIVEMEGEDVSPNKTLNLTQAGTLSSLLTAEEKAAITKLTLTGNIDARDFKTMRDEMPLLEDLNLLNSTIVLYYGSGGTYSLDYTTYPANEVPASSFYNHQNLSKVILPSTAIKIGQTAFRSCANLKTVDIPLSVFVIDDFAFYMSHQMESVLISSTITIIGYCAFSDCSASIVVDADNPDFSSIDGVLFNKDQSVLIQVPNTVSGVYSIPTTVKTVQHDAFLVCSQLTSIIIPSSVQVIEDWAFGYCSGLTSIKIYSPIPVDISTVWETTLEGINFSTCTLYVPKGSKAAYQASLGWKEFTNIVEMEGGVSSDVTLNLTQAGTLSLLLTTEEKVAITKLTLTGNIDARDFKTMRDEMPLLEDIDLGQATIVEYTGAFGPIENESTTYSADAIPPYSFSPPLEFKQFKLKSIVFPGNLKSIGYQAFYNSCPLTSITIPKYVEKIEDGAFSYCNQIKEFIVSVDNEYLTSINGVVFSKDVSELIVYPGAIEGTYQVPEIVKRIANTAFEGKWKLTSVQLPEGLEEIGDVAFSSCPLESVNFPESLVYIGYNAFITCTKLAAIDLSNCSKLTSLNWNTFNYCTSLSEVKLPETITYIDSWVFEDCNKLSLFTIKNPIPPDLGTDVFLNASTSSCTLYVPKGSKAAYQAADQWKDFYFIEELDFTGNEIYPEQNGWKAYSSNGQLAVEGLEPNSLVVIFSITGQKIFEGKSEGNSLRIDLKKNQTYIVRVNNESKKIVHQ